MGSSVSSVFKSAISPPDFITGQSSRDAASAQAAATNKATNLQSTQWKQQRLDYQPYLDVGYRSLGAMEDILLGARPQIDPATGQPLAQQPAAPDYSAFYQSPDYQFRLSEGQKALERSAAARGGALSGAATKAAMDYGQNIAAGEYGNYMNRLASLAGVGQTGLSESSARSAQSVGAISDLMQRSGEAQASGYTAAANTQTQGLATIATAAMMAFCDERLKENTEQIGEWHGLPVYEFNYHGNDKRFRSPTAQDIATIRPDAVKVGAGGYLMVDFGKLDFDFKEVA